jgi:hypothetical protein
MPIRTRNSFLASAKINLPILSTDFTKNLKNHFEKLSATAFSNKLSAIEKSLFTRTLS